MKSFAVIFHEAPSVLLDLSPTQMQEVVARYRAWFEPLRQNGRIRTSIRLKDDGGQHLHRQQQRVLASDGPFAEAKDVVSGLFVLGAESYEDAQAVLATCPHFDFGWTEVREIEFLA